MKTIYILPRRSYGNPLFLAIFLACLMLLSVSCKKDWLDAKPDSHLVVLSTVSDYQSLLDNGMLYSTISLGEVGTDDYFIPQAKLSILGGNNLSYYLWAPNGFPASSDDNWSWPYANIFSCNTALEGLDKIEKNTSNESQWNQVYGTALFYRAYQYIQLAESFMKPFDSSAVNSDPGVPLRLEADISQKVGRGTAGLIYQQILTDLLKAKTLLPISSPQYKTRPNKQAAYSLLARYYLEKEDYSNAFLNADSALQLNDNLLDYNALQRPAASARLSMPSYANNPEVFFYLSGYSSILTVNTAAIDTTLYASYDNNDLRKTFFFNTTRYAPSISFRGTYDGISYNGIFTAPAVDELYLIRAECNARLGYTEKALSDLNTLLSKRWITGTFIPITASDADDALTKVLVERRKELVMRGTRWTDLRRLNKDARFQTTVIRIYNGQTYILAPGSNLYTWPIPDNEILYSGITQNPRS